MMTLAEENYLKAIFHLELESVGEVSTNAIAESMETKPSSVTDMMKKLADKKLVDYKKYQGAKLSTSGRETAIKVIRKHRLWEVFLVDKLEFSWDEVHEIAEQLEHIHSEKLIRQLDKFLGYPKRDPHGDPIPDADGNFMVTNKTLLSELEEGQTGICVGVKDSSSTFLKYLNKHHISLGQKIQIVEKEAFDHSMQIKIGEEILRISGMVANNLFLKIA